MLETEADRLGYLCAFGGLVNTDAGDLFGIFANAGESLSFDTAEVVAAGPQLTVRTSDCVECLGLKRGDVVRVGSDSFRIAALSHDGTGMSTLDLEKI
jgi:hypothetical protein